MFSVIFTTLYARFSFSSYSCSIYSSLLIPSLLSREQKSFVKILKVKYIKRLGKLVLG